MIASVHLSTVTGEDIRRTISIRTSLSRQHSVDLTRDQARQAADALRACALTAIDAKFGNAKDIL